MQLRYGKHFIRVCWVDTLGSIKGCLCSAICALNMWLTGSVELAKFHFTEKLTNCAHSTTSIFHSGADLQSENKSVS